MSALHYQSPESMTALPLIPQATPRKSKRRSARVLATASAVVTPIFEAVPVAIPKGRASNRTFTVIVSLILGIGFVLTLQFQVMAGAASFKKHALEIQLSNLSAKQQALESEVALGESPDQLMTSARKLGMVPASNPVFIRLSDHKVLGKPIPAEARTFK